MAKRGGKLGDAYVDIHASTDNLKADLENAKTETERAASNMGNSVDTHVTKRWQDASSKVTGFIGSVTSIIGVAYVFERLGEKISSLVLYFTRAGDAAREFQQDVSRLSVEQINKQLDELNDSTTSGAANAADLAKRFTDYLGLTENAARAAKIAILEEARAAETAREVAERASKIKQDRIKAEKEAAARRSDIDAQNEQLEIDQLQGIKKIEAERERAKRETLKKIQSEEDYIARLRLEYQLALIDKKYQADIDKARDAEQEKQRLAEDSARKQAEALASALTGALNQVLKQQATSQNVAGPIQELGNRIIAEIQSLKFRGGM